MTVTDDDLGVIREIKQRARRTWAAGDYDVVVDGIWEAGGAVTRIAGVGPGDEVLDVACGSGNAAIQAAQAGGKVTGVDLTPELFEAGRRRSLEAGVEVDFIEGDAEDLPFEEGSFDVVLSTFGVMFAPRHAVAAKELVRVLRPGGRIGLATWAPEGTVGEFFRTMGRHLPPPPPVAESPLLWGDLSHVRRLLGDGVDLELIPSLITLRADGDTEASVDVFLDVFPPLVTARALLEAEGAWEAAEDDLRQALVRMYQGPAAYLLIGGTRSTAPMHAAG
jgi:SAM-dependent methyltransferase